jgi:UDP-N-acetylmuramate--alanine ligase
VRVFKHAKHIFFTGIGGIGMSGIAEIMMQSGYRVSGSDKNLSDITSYLADEGAEIFEGHSAGNLKDADVLVYSSAVKENNPERQEAFKKNIPQIRRAEMLAEVMRLKYGVAVAGTHGKTTTTAMLSEIFIHAGLDPTVVIGGRLHSLKTNARLGNGEFFIAEADEYDRSFLALSPVFAIITSIDADHLDCYKDLEDIEKTFLIFAQKIPFYGSLVCCYDNLSVKKIAANLKCPVISYGSDRLADFYPLEINFSGNGSVFRLIHHKSEVGEVVLQIPGKHNILNALGATALAMEVEIPFEAIQKALADFKGVERRFQLKGISNDIMVVDDYAHHPAEIQATLSGARSGFKRRIIAVFQPHLFSRTRDFYREFAEALSTADIVVLTDIYPAREEAIPGISSLLIVDALKKISQAQVFFVPERKEIARTLLTFLQPEDLVITLGAGDIWKTGEELMEII